MNMQKKKGNLIVIIAISIVTLCLIAATIAYTRVISLYYNTEGYGPIDYIVLVTKNASVPLHIKYSLYAIFLLWAIYFIYLIITGINNLIFKKKPQKSPIKLNTNNNNNQN